MIRSRDLSGLKSNLGKIQQVLDEDVYAELIDLINKLDSNIIELNNIESDRTSGYISSDDFLTRRKLYTKEQVELKQKITNIQQLIESNDYHVDVDQIAEQLMFEPL